MRKAQGPFFLSFCCVAHASVSYLRITGQFQLPASEFFGNEIIEMSSDFLLGGNTKLVAAADSAYQFMSPSGLKTHVGAVHLLWMEETLQLNGTTSRKIANTSTITDGLGLPVGILRTGDYFGVELARLPDINGDGAVREVAVGSMNWAPQGNERYGAVFILFLGDNAEVESYTVISNEVGGGPHLQSRDAFGRGIAAINSSTLAVGAIGDDDGGPGSGAVYILHLLSTGECQSYVKLFDGQNGVPKNTFQRYNFWGVTMKSAGDLDNDGNDNEVVVCAALDGTGGSSRGGCIVLALAPSLDRVLSLTKIADGRGGIEAGSLKGYNFGMGLSVADFDGDGSFRDLLVAGAPQGGKTAIYTMRLSRQGRATEFRRLKTFDYIPSFGRQSSGDSSDAWYTERYDYSGDGLAPVTPASDPFGPSDLLVGAPGLVQGWNTGGETDWNRRASGAIVSFGSYFEARVHALDQQVSRCGQSSPYAVGVVPEIRGVLVELRENTNGETGTSEGGSFEADDSTLGSADTPGWDDLDSEYHPLARLRQAGGTRIAMDLRVPAAWRIRMLPEERMSRGLPAMDNDEDPLTIRAFTAAIGDPRRANCTMIRQRRSSCGAVISCRTGPGLGLVAAHVQYHSAQRLTDGEPTASERSAVAIRYEDPEVLTVSTVPATRFLRQAGGGILVMLGQNLFDLNHFPASGSGLPLGARMFVGPYECQQQHIRRSFGGRSLQCHSIPPGFGGPHPIRFQLPGGIVAQMQDPSTFIQYEPAHIEGMIPSLVYLDPSPEASQRFQIRGSRLGNPEVITSVRIGGLECTNLTMHLDGSGLNCTAGLSGYTSSDVQVLHGGVKSTGGEDLLEYTVPPRIAGATPALLPVSGGVNVSFFGFIGASQSQIGDVFIGKRACLEWAVLSEVLLRCLAPPGTGSALKASILSPAGVRTFSAFPLVSYEAPVLESVSPNGLLSNPTVSYDFVLHGSNFGSERADVKAVAVGGAQCTDFELVNSSTLLCNGVRPPWTSTRASVQVSDQTGVLEDAVRFQPQPRVSGVSPQILPTSGRTGPELSIPVVVKISGEGFGMQAGDIDTVTVGDTPCLSVSHVSSFELHCEPPPGIGTGKMVIVYTQQNGNSTSTLTSTQDEELAMLTYRPPGLRGIVARTTGPYMPGSNVSMIQNGPWPLRPVQSYIIGGEEEVSVQLRVTNTGPRLADVENIRFLIDDDEDDRRGWGCDRGSVQNYSCGPTGVPSAGTCEIEVIQCQDLDFAGVEEPGVLRAYFAVAGQPVTVVPTTDPSSIVGAQYPLSIEIVGRPSISIVTPNEFPTLGSTARRYQMQYPESGFWPSKARIVGDNFGYAAHDVINVTVGGVAATSAEWVSPTELEVGVPPGAGAGQPVVVTTSGGLASDSVGARISYSRPQIDSISPAYVFAGQGRTNLRITGMHFGNSVNDLDSILLQIPSALGSGEAQKINCQEIHWDSPFEINCTIGSLDLLGIEDLGIDEVEAAALRSRNVSGSPLLDPTRDTSLGQVEVGVPLVVSIGGQQSTVSSQSPTVTVLGKPVVSLVSPNSVPTEGSSGEDTPVQLIGQGFGEERSDVLQVKIGGRACRVVTFVSSGELQVSIPPGAGKNLDVIVTTRGGLSSDPSLHAKIGYEAPMIEAVEPSHIFAANRSSPVALKVHGSNFGPPGTVSVGGGVSLDQIGCNVTTQNHTFIECTVDAKAFERYPELYQSSGGTSTGRLAMISPVSASITVTVDVALQQTQSIGGPSNSIEVVGRPKVALINPRVIPTAGSQALDSVATSGNGTMVSVLGYGFGFAPMDVVSVTVGGTPCPQIVWVGGTEIQVIVPAGVGQLQAIEVRTRGGLASLSTNEGSFVQYRQSAVTSIVPAYSMTGDLTADFTLRGSDFGNSPADLDGIVIGGRPCAQVHWLSASQVNCSGVDASFWEGSSAVAIVGGQVGSANSLFEAVDTPVVDVVSPQLFSAGDSIVILGQKFGYALSDVKRVTVAGRPCESFELLGPTAIRCIAPSAPPALLAQATENPEGLRDLPLVVTTSGGLQSAAHPVSYAGSGVAPITSPANVLAYRPVGSAQRLNMRWTFPIENPTDAVEPVRSFEILLVAAQEAGHSTTDRSAESEEEQQMQVVSIRADGADEIVETTDGILVYRHTIFAFTTAPVFIRVRASNSVGPGPYSDLAQGPLAAGVTDQIYSTSNENDRSESGLHQVWSVGSNVTKTNAIRATCKESEYMASHLDIQMQTCLQCPRAAYCGGSGANNVTARDGYWRVPWSKGGLGFSKCYFPPACLGYETFDSPTYADAYDRGYIQSRRQLQRLTQQQISSATEFLPEATAGSQLYALSTELQRDSAPTAVPPENLGNPLLYEQCSEGYTGVLCSACSPGYARWGNHECRKCKSSRMLAAALVGIFLFIFIVVAWLVINALRINSNPNGQRIETAILKIMFNHAQTVSIAASLDLRWPDSAMQLFSMMQTGGFSSSYVLSLDCMIEVPEDDVAGFTVGNRTVWFQEDTLGTGVAVPYQSMFLARSLVVLCIPVLLIMFAAVFWYCFAPVVKCCLYCCPKTSEDDEVQSDAAVEVKRTLQRLQSDSASATGAPASPAQNAPEDLLSETAAKYTRHKRTLTDESMLARRRSSSGAAGQLPSRGRRSSFALMREQFSLSSRFVGADLSIWHKVMVTSLIILFLGHMSVTQTSLGLLTCTNVQAETEAGVPEGMDPDSIEVTDVSAIMNHDLDPACPASHPDRRLLGDLNVCCYDPRALAYMFGLGLPGMMLYAVGIPAIAAFAVFQQRNNLNDPVTRATLGFLYAGYREESWFWESVVMLRKVSIAAVAVFLEPQGVAVQTYAALVIIFALTIVQLKVEPFDPVKAPILNHMELASLVASFLTFECGLFLVDDEASPTYKALASIGIFVANIGFLGWAVSRLGMSAYRSWQESKAQEAAVKRGSLRNVLRGVERLQKRTQSEARVSAAIPPGLGLPHHKIVLQAGSGRSLSVQRQGVASSRRHGGAIRVQIGKQTRGRPAVVHVDSSVGFQTSNPLQQVPPPGMESAEIQAKIGSTWQPSAASAHGDDETTSTDYTTDGSSTDESE